MFQIMDSEVDFWGRKELDIEDMKLMHKEKMYPPKVTVMVYSNSTSTVSCKKTHTFTMEITGIREEAFNMNITKDFGAGTVCS